MKKEQNAKQSIFNEKYEIVLHTPYSNARCAGGFLRASGFKTARGPSREVGAANRPDCGRNSQRHK